MPREATAKLKPKHEYVLLLASMGVSKEEIADETGYAIGSINNLLYRPQSKRRLEELTDKWISAIMDRQLKQMGVKAVQVLDKAMDMEEHKTSDSLNAAMYTINRIQGKPAQPLEHSVTPYNKLLEKLDTINLDNEKLLEGEDVPIDAEYSATSL